MEDYNNYTFRNKDVDKMKRSKLRMKKMTRSQKLRMKSEKTLAKAKKAVDEGREKNADRLHKKAAQQKNRSYHVEYREDGFPKWERKIKKKKKKYDREYERMQKNKKGN